MANADTAPLTVSMPTTIHSCAWPVMISAAAAPCVTAVSAWETCMTVVREKRSDTTPPTSRKSTMAAVRAVSTWARAAAESLMWSTAKARPTGAIAEPTVETVRAAKYHANRRSRSTPRASDHEVVTVGPAGGRP